MTPEPRLPGGHSYDQLRDRAVNALESGDLETALALFERAYEEAEGLGEPVLVDRAFLNRVSVSISLGRGRRQVAPLREILVRSADDVNCCLAAYNIARIYEHEKNYKKGLFYARIARDRSLAAGSFDGDWIGGNHNQIGNFLVAESRFEEAAGEYHRALDASSGGQGGDVSSDHRASIRQNLGYCHLMLGRFHRGFELLHDSLRHFRGRRLRRQAMGTHLDLCYGYLEIGRLSYAERHGERALTLAEDLGGTDAMKNALYLLGETANLLGEEERARGYFDRLQRHFPEAPFLTDFLLAIDVRKMINLRA